MPKEVIQISDDEETASSGGLGPSRTSSRGLGNKGTKRRLTLSEPEGRTPEKVEEKVEWTDDEDDAYTKFKNRRSAKRRSIAKGKKPQRQQASDKSKKRRKATYSGLTSELQDRDETSAVDDFVEAEIPEYLRRRRQEFDQNRATLQEAGLKLPPGFDGIDFSDDERLGSLEERPKFDEASGIKPSREYKDVELEYSAGLIPACIAQYLRDYQIVGVKFLHQLFVYQKGGVLGDDMGLGKTVQVAAFLTAAFGKTGDERDSKRMRKLRRAGDHWYPRALIVCPGSLIQNWKNELNRWGWWHVDVFHGPGKEDVLQAARAGRIEVMVTTYTTYKNNQRSVNSVPWDVVIADECHLLKERTSETTRAMNEVNALCRIGLTGTAIQNKYEELWTLLNWTNPAHFGTISEWRHTISKPLTLGQSHDATLHQLSVARKTAKKLVQNLLPEFFLRRMKNLIADQLPKKSDKVVFCPLTDVQREAYASFLEGDNVSFINSVSEICPCGSGRKWGWCCGKTMRNGHSWQKIVFPTVITLQKLANHLALLIPSSSDPPEKQKSALMTLQTCVPEEWEDLYRNRDSIMILANPEFCGKWKVLKKLLRFWHENGDKVLVFSHSVRLLRILQHLFHNTSYSVSYLDGSLTYEERQRVVDDFNTDPGQFVFLISTKSGGVGLNITSANKVVIFDPHWNPSFDLQAQDRAYRIGQVRDVDVFRLISAGTIEEIVYARQIYKQQQANIGYNASNERRYFKGVQQDSDRKGEIFGLSNLFTFHADHIVLREIVNKTNIAEAKAGVNLTEIDMEKMSQDEEVNLVKKEEADDENGGMSQLAELLTAENKEDLLDSKSKKPKTDAVAAILSSAGVEYTHENSEVIGSSKVEAQLSKRAEMAVADDSQCAEGNSALFADTQASAVENAGETKRFRFEYNPPADVMKRQFCSMAKEFGFLSATDFALVAENWTTEQRRNCLDVFYKGREARLLELELEALKKDESDEQDISMVSRWDDNKQVGIIKDEEDISTKKALAKEEKPATSISSLSREIKAWTEEKKVLASAMKHDGDEEDDDDDEL